jgi:phospholipid/cholesterol/gamma-HCH transport system substrate-binding protein
VTKNAPSRGAIAAMVLFTLSVFGLLLWLWLSFGGPVPLQPQSYRAEAAFPEAALLVEEADVRLAGVNIGKVKSKKLSKDERRTVAVMEIDPKFAPLKANTRAILRQKSLLGETYVELSPGGPGGPDLPDGGRLPNAQIADTVELDEIFSIFNRRTRRNLGDWLREAGIAFSGDYGRDLNAAFGNAAPFFQAGAKLLRPLDRQKLAVRRLVRNTGRTLDAITAQTGQLRGLIVGGERTFGALASRDQELADTVRVLPTFLRETRATTDRLERFAINTDPLVRDLRAPADDLAPTLRDLNELSPDLEQLFRDVTPLTDASATGLPAADRFIRGAEPVLGAVHTFQRELNPILSFLGYSRQTVASFITLGGAALAGNEEGGYTRRTPGGEEHYLPQSAIIDGRSLMRRVSQPPWERANAYIVPNAYQRAIGLGVIESFECSQAGGQRPNPSGEAITAAPPCFVAPKQLFQDQKYPRLRAGQAPVVPAPQGREGTRPATP